MYSIQKLQQPDAASALPGPTPVFDCYTFAGSSTITCMSGSESDY
jgi:hypothetical protein